MSARHQIIASALKHMAARGAEAASLRAIADDVGIRKPSIMYHFASKEALRQAVLEELLSRWNEVLPRLIMATSRDGALRFEALTCELIDFFSEDPNRAKLILREMLDRPDEMQPYLLSYVRPWITVIADQIQSGIKSGDVSPDIDAQAFIWVIVNSVVSNIAISASHAQSVLSETHAKGANARLNTELIRMARASLFHPQRLVETLPNSTETTNA